MDGAGAVIAPSEEAPPQLKRTVPGVSPTTTPLGDLSAFALDSAIVLAGGDHIVGDENGQIHRFSAAGPVWSPAPSLGSAVHGPMVLSGTTAPFIVPTNAGKVFALADDGQTRWEGTLPSATQLRAGNIHTPGGQPAGPTMSVAYFTSGNGRLYAVVVDGQLDATAPWPKAFHDPRNTNRAGPQP
jgi:outer membrane protein assembly factor BamB